MKIATDKVLIASPVRQKPEILAEFLASLNRLDLAGLEVSYYFIDDNDNPFSVKMLRDFNPRHGNRGMIKMVVTADRYIPHEWNAALCKKLCGFKEHILTYARENNFSLFLVDSDLVLHPATLKHLLASGKSIISEIYWSNQPRREEGVLRTARLPQLWLGAPGCFVEHNASEFLSESVQRYRAANILHQLELPGLYEVGGVSGCLYISGSAIQTGLSFRQFEKINLPKPDDYFSFHAAAAGIARYADTHYPAFHIFCEADLAEAAEYVKKTEPETSRVKEAIPEKEPALPEAIMDEEAQEKDTSPEISSPKNTYWMVPGKTPTEQRRVKPGENQLTLAMLVQKESAPFLPAVLRQAARYIDRAVILDNSASEQTAALCREALGDIPLSFHYSTAAANEQQLRHNLWNHVIETTPDWIFLLDPAEIPEEAAADQIRTLLDDSRWDHYAFPIYDFWNETHYREDCFWQSHHTYQILLLRYQPNFEYQWREVAAIPERCPGNIQATAGTASELRIKNLGWTTPAARRFRFEQYQKRPPGAGYEVTAKYLTLFSENPRLIRWTE